MSNPAVITLAEIKNGIAGFDRLQIEDNIGESIHLHIGQARLDLTVNEFIALAKGMKAALNATGRFAPYAAHQFDPMFLLTCGALLEHLESIHIEERFIDDLRCIVHRSIRFGVYNFVPITKTPAYRFLASKDESFLKYEQNSYLGMKNRERLLALAKNIREFGYPYEGRHIILFDGQNLIRDGQHRVAALRHLWGNVKIPVMIFKFSTSAVLPLIQWRTYAGIPFRFAHAAMSQLRRGLR